VLSTHAFVWSDAFESHILAICSSQHPGTACASGANAPRLQQGQLAQLSGHRPREHHVVLEGSAQQDGTHPANRRKALKGEGTWNWVRNFAGSTAPALPQPRMHDPCKHTQVGSDARQLPCMSLFPAGAQNGEPSSYQADVHVLQDCQLPDLSGDGSTEDGSAERSAQRTHPQVATACPLQPSVTLHCTPDTLLAAHDQAGVFRHAALPCSVRSQWNT
jgi:hypothetical protein